MAIWIGVVFLCLAPAQLQAQSARTTITATATVAAEETYVARDAVQAAIRAGDLGRAGTKEYKGVTIVERWARPATPSAKGECILTVYFPGT